MRIPADSCSDSLPHDNTDRLSASYPIVSFRNPHRLVWHDHHNFNARSRQALRNDHYYESTTPRYDSPVTTTGPSLMTLWATSLATKFRRLMIASRLCLRLGIQCPRATRRQVTWLALFAPTKHTADPFMIYSKQVLRLRSPSHRRAPTGSGQDLPSPAGRSLIR